MGIKTKFKNFFQLDDEYDYEYVEERKEWKNAGTRNGCTNESETKCRKSSKCTKIFKSCI